jgi:S1-C subfamily serine protease
MAMVSVTCPACQGTVQVSDRLPNNSRIHCPTCGNKFNYTRAEAPAAKAEAPAAIQPSPENRAPMSPADAAETDLFGTSPAAGQDVYSPAAYGQPADHYAPPSYGAAPYSSGPLYSSGPRYSSGYAKPSAPPAQAAPATISRGLIFGGLAVAAAMMLMAIVCVAGLVLYFGMSRFGRDDSATVAANATVDAATGEGGGAGNVASAAGADDGVTHSGLEAGSTVPRIEPLPSGVAQSMTTVDSQLKYKWETGKSYQCSFDISFGRGAQQRKYNGVTTYTPTSADPRRVADVAKSEEEEGSGTAFVVHPQGVLVTCAHVVEGASAVSVVLDGKTLPARVIDLDRRKDLALLRINTDNLRYLMLGDSDTIRLAEPIRVVGYPLTDMLGESIKVSSGEVSGVIDRKSNKMLQIDATVNPGNSGGPVVDSRGRVVGVASALLAGSDIASMGFAVPSADVAAMLRRNKIPLAKAIDAPELSGPDLAASVTPAVLLVKVKLGPGGAGGPQRVVSFHGQIMSGSSGSRKSEAGELVVNPFGEVTHNSGTIELPAMTGQLGGIGLEPLPSDASETWQQMRMSAVTRLKRTAASPYDGLGSPYSPYSRYGRRRLRPPIGPPSSSVKVEIVPAVQLIEYEIGNDKGETVEIKKSHHLTTIHDEGEATYLDVEGKGTIVFDKALGMPRTMQYSGIVSVTENTTTVRIPYTISYRFHESGGAGAPKSDLVKSPPRRESTPRSGAPVEVSKPAAAPAPPVRKLAEPGTAPTAIARPTQRGGLDKFDPES